MQQTVLDRKKLVMNSASPPAVSVVMPVYQVERYVTAAVHSVLDQTFRDFELIIVDDGGTDNSIALCQAIDDPRIRIVRQANRGLAGARNTGIAASTGEFVALIDSDDIWLPEKLAHHVAYLRANAHVGVSYDACDLIDENGHRIGVRQRPKPGLADARHVFHGRTVKNGSAAVLRRRTLEDAALRAPNSDRVWYFDETLRRSEDVECWTRIALTTTWRFSGLRQVLTLYRVNLDGLSADIPRQLESWECVFEKIRAYAPDFIAAYGVEARARELRWLARRGFRSGDVGLAFHLIVEALRLCPHLLLTEPVRTSVTFAACAVARALPAARLHRSIPGLINPRRGSEAV